MKTTIRVFLLGLLSFVLCMCKPINPVDVNTEKEIIDLIFQSLNNTHEQIAEKILGMGFYEAAYLEILNYQSFTNENPNSTTEDPNRVLISVQWDENQNISLLGYERKLVGFDNPAAHYNLLSNKTAEYPYTDWQGYYAEDEEYGEKEGLISSFVQAGYLNEEFYNLLDINKTTNRDEYLNHLTNNKNFSNNDIQQGYVETFIYTHNDNSKWSGKIGLYTYSLSYGFSEEEGPITEKNIYFEFYLTRIQ